DRVAAPDQRDDLVDGVQGLQQTAQDVRPLLGTGPVVSANTAGEGSVLIVLETDGSLHGYDITTGKRVSETKPLVRGDLDAGTDGKTGPVIEVDRSRAYLNDPEGKRVYEIDYNDNLRVARTFDLDIVPALMVETGR
ncbi:hypothetical protein ABZ322_33685, partial [Streptomyces sp. NPDC006129]